MNEYSKVFGERIKQLREFKRLSLRDLAYITGISHTGIRNYEKGLRSMDIEQIDTLCKALDYDTKTFIDECFDIIQKRKGEGK